MPQKQPKEVKKVARKIIENELANKVIGMAIEIHSALGPGLLERAYQECLYYKIQKSGLNVEKEKPMPLIFEEVKLECGYRIDLLVENKLVLEIKSVEALTDIHFSQTLTYKRLLFTLTFGQMLSERLCRDRRIWPLVVFRRSFRLSIEQEAQTLHF